MSKYLRHAGFVQDLVCWRSAGVATLQEPPTHCLVLVFCPPAPQVTLQLENWLHVVKPEHWSNFHKGYSKKELTILFKARFWLLEIILGCNRTCFTDTLARSCFYSTSAGYTTAWILTPRCIALINLILTSRINPRNLIGQLELRIYTTYMCPAQKEHQSKFLHLNTFEFGFLWSCRL